jgi:hypothetical protein
MGFCATSAPTVQQSSATSDRPLTKAQIASIEKLWITNPSQPFSAYNTIHGFLPSQPNNNSAKPHPEF